MGRPKLLLPYRGATVIDHVLGAWARSRVECVVVVVRPSDHELADRCRAAGAEVVVPEHAPSEMKRSVGLALDYVRDRYQPVGSDAWLLAPADLPQLTHELIDFLLAEFATVGEQTIVVPRGAGGRGHPVIFPWLLADQVARLGAEQGVNSLLKEYDVREVTWHAPQDWQDLDTPEQYRRLEE